MDINSIAGKLGLVGSKQVIRKAEELRRQADVQFDSSVMGIVCKAIICLEIAATRLQVLFDRQAAVKMCGMSEKAYIRSFNGIQNSIGIKARLDARELGIQFGCVRLIPFVQKGLSLYKTRFLTALPPSRRANTDFSRPVFTAVAFYLCAKKHKLKVDKVKLIELCATTESEFTSVSTSMKDLCFDVFGISKEKADPKAVRGNRGSLSRRHEDDGDVSDSSEDVDDELALPAYKRHKKMERMAYEEWKSTVISSNKEGQPEDASTGRKKQSRLNFTRKPSRAVPSEA
ncbi:unnamed protein product [Spirodela intermedia]|uniref:Origin of replication complex subunit 6 n=1 Tax=Spirodela intermedia TaxID=51605 RepID=A0A7I8IP94_SPIIN|nr:unnamed protein product [Spirodela intermedia]CAA6659768.1 unnamed protein product [Spirodela intermedia]